MGSFPIVYHVGPFTLTAYGIGLALTFLFAYWYLSWRLERRGLPQQWLVSGVWWVIVASVVGARAASVASNWASYRARPWSAVDFWHGGWAGLSSFGGLAVAVPVALWLVHRRAPEAATVQVLDVGVPVLTAGWALGRAIACQFMVNAGGPVTTAWYGLAYSGQAGRRVPVPLFQSVEDWAIFALLLGLERWRDRRRGPVGLVAAAGVALWGLTRASDEWLFFLRSGHGGAIATALAGLAFFAGGVAAFLWLLQRRRLPVSITACPGASPPGPAAVAPGMGATAPEVCGSVLIGTHLGYLPNHDGGSNAND